MVIKVTEFLLYDLFEHDDVDRMIKLLDGIGLDGQSGFQYDYMKESFLRHLLSIASVHSSSNHLSNYMLNQLIGRISVCCSIYHVSRLATIAADIKPSSTAKVPENIRQFLNMDAYSSDDIHDAVQAFDSLGEQALRALLRYFADMTSEIAMYPPLCFNPPIMKRLHICGLLPANVLLSIMAATLFEADRKKKGLIKRLFS